MKKIILLLIVSIFIFSCDNDDISQAFNPKLKFTFNWDGEPVNLSDFNDIKYTNENGEQLSITRLRYLISNISLVNSSSDGTLVKDFNLVDLTNQLGLGFTATTLLPITNYNAIKFTVGFNEEDNILEYPDLNIVNWNWNPNLGGGYHIMQYEGLFINSIAEEKPYAMHLGTRKVSAGVYEPNHFEITLNFEENTVLNSDSEIEIQMNIAEWFKNPNTWDLNVLSAPLMPVYEAQVMMHENGSTVFSVKVN